MSKSLVRHNVYALLLAAGLALAHPLPAVANEPHFFQVRSGDNTEAIRDFAAQSGMQIVAAEDALAGKTLRDVSGTLSLEEGLRTLLRGTGLTHKYIGNTAVALVREDRRIRVAQSDESVPPSPPTEAASTTSLEEVVVTAQKREERLRDVPISISVLKGADLDRTTSGGVMDAISRTPGVAFFSGPLGGVTQVSVRGVSAAGALFTGSSPIAYYVDSVPFGLVKTSLLPDTGAYDLERVEVLRGPQGTLYGASAQNGVVRILTHDADLSEFEAKTRASGSATQSGGANYRADAAINIPLVRDVLAARITVGYENDSGWIDRPNDEDANDAILKNLRLKVNAKPTDQLSIGLSAWSSRSSYGAPSYSPNGRDINITSAEPIHTDFDTYGLKVGYNFDAFSVTSATSFIDYTNRSLYLFGNNGAPLLTTVNGSRVFTQEVYLSSQLRGPWRWTAGGSFRHGRDLLLQELVLIPAPLNWGERSQSYAAFGELTRELPGRFELTGGARYFIDDVTQVENTSGTKPPTPLYRRDNTFHKVSPRGVLTWHPSDSTTLYASYSEGFRSGSAQNASVARTAPNFPPIHPDNLKNYEVGAKGVFLDGRLSYDSAVYYMDWQDVQQSLRVPVPGVANLYVSGNVNGQSASGIGVDFSVSVQPIDHLHLSANFSWNNLEEDAAVLTRPAGATSDVVLFPKGARLAFSPALTAGASADYVMLLGGSGYKAAFSASVNHVSAEEFRAVAGTGVQINRGDPMTIGRVAASLVAPTRWTATLYVDNVNNEQGSPYVNGGGGRTDRDMRVRPRTAGVQVEYQF